MQTLWQVEADFIHMIAEMKRTGIKVDKPFCKPRIAKGKKICNEIASDLGWNPGSTKQLGEFLLGEMGYPVVRRTEKGNPSFDKYALEEYEEMLQADGSDVAQKVLRYRGWQKTVSSNYEAYCLLADKNSILHPNYKVHGTRTCRISCENPNLQQIPKETIKEWNGDVKRAFIPRYDNTLLIEFDAAQLETRLAAAVAEEQELLDAFWEGVDVFQVMAERLGWLRDDCKTLTYATLYGAGIRRIATIFGISRQAAADRIEEFFGSYPKLRAKAKEAKLIAQRTGYIQYWTGRRRHFRKGDEYRKAFNAYVQGGAYEIVKRCGLRLWHAIEEIGEPWPMVLTVHDSYVLEIPRAQCTEENLGWIRQTLEAVPESKEMGVPFKWDYKIWGQKDLTLSSLN